MDKTIIALATAAIYHNGKRYEVGDEIEVTEQQFAQLSPYLKLSDEARLAKQEAQRQAEEQALALAEQATQERQALLDELNDVKQRHLQAEALATEQGLRADELAKTLETTKQQLAEKTAELEKIKAQLAKTKSAKETPTDQEDKD